MMASLQLDQLFLGIQHWPLTTIFRLPYADTVNRKKSSNWLHNTTNNDLACWWFSYHTHKVRLTSFQKPTIAIRFNLVGWKFVEPCPVPFILLGYLRLLIIFWAVIFMFDSIWGKVLTVRIDRILIKFMTQLRQTEASLRASPPGRSVGGAGN